MPESESNFIEIDPEPKTSVNPDKPSEKELLEPSKQLGELADATLYKLHRYLKGDGRIIVDKGESNPIPFYELSTRLNFGDIRVNFYDLAEKLPHYFKVVDVPTLRFGERSKLVQQVTIMNAKELEHLVEKLVNEKKITKTGLQKANKVKKEGLKK